MADDNGSRRAGNAGHVVVLGNPVTVETEFFSMPCKLQTVAKRLASITALCDRSQIQYR